jgi:hypothetical protein
MFTRIITLTAVTALAISSTAMARGGGGGGGWHGGMAMHGHGHFDNRHFDNRFARNRFLRNLFLRNQALLGGWGWGWGWGGYGDNGYGNTTVVAFPQAVPQLATGSTSSGPCHWNDNAFTVPSSAGGTRQVSVVSCQSSQLASEPEGASNNK